MTSREEVNKRARRWYRENREKVRARHKERMQYDPEYRERTREAQRKAYAKRRAKLMASRPPVKLDNTCRELDGKLVQTFTVAETARLLEVGNSTVNCWMMRGDIPTPLFAAPILFTRTQVHLLRKLKITGLSRKARKDAKKEIFKNWNWH